MAPGFGTPAVALATTPTVLSTFFSHVLNRKSRSKAAKKSLAEGGPGAGPEDDLTYEEGLKVVRRFIDFASHHGVEEVQAFTAMPIPTPVWVNKQRVIVPEAIITRAEGIMEEHLGTYGPSGANGGGIELVGGSKWWRVRGRQLEGEWIEMQKDYLRRTATRQSTVTDPVSPVDAGGSSSHRHSFLPRRQATMGSIKDNAGKEVIGDRVILYIHGGAFFFSSLDTHRYQVQRHARKAGARAFCPAYRLAPQYPFPCGLLDALASYLYLLDPPPGHHTPILPTSIILMGDSAGAGMVVSLLVIIREMGLPMPAGASLISPWVDLTHSMPSIGGWDGGDFIPSSGFHYKPSCAWPPLPGDGIELEMADGTKRQFDEQIQMYCPNNLLTHPLVSPVNLGSLGGLCPLMIVGGGGELLRDEIIYLAHKAAAPATYVPASRTLEQFPDQVPAIKKYKPTRVHLQIYEGCCHVVPTLAWTSSSKYMYRACANFNIWAFTAAAKALEHRLHHKSSKHRLNDVSRSSTVDAGSSSENSPLTTAPSSAAPSTRPSALDLTKPMIDTRAARAANAEILEAGDLESEASSSSDDCSSQDQGDDDDPAPPTGTVAVRGAENFGSSYIVSERVSTRGKIRPFEPIEAIPALDPKLRDHIGQVHSDGAITKWLAKRTEWDEKYSRELKKWRKVKEEDRIRAQLGGYLTRGLDGERPPLASLAGIWDQDLARKVGRSVDEVSKKTSGAMLMWSNMAGKADEEHAGGRNLVDIKHNVTREIKEEERLQSAAQRDDTRS